MMLLLTVSLVLGLAVQAYAHAQVPSYGVWTAVGCQTVQLPFYVGRYSNLTVEMCLNSCHNLGLNGYPYQYAAVIRGDTCYCGMTPEPGAHSVNPGLCDTACAGNANQTCGGVSSIAAGFIWGVSTLYTLIDQIKAVPKAVEAHDVWKSMGCWTDSASTRALFRKEITTTYTISVQDCLYACKTRGQFRLAGVEYGKECWCGNVIQHENKELAAPEAAEKCSLPCNGNPSQICGGSGALSLFERTDLNPWAYPPFSSGTPTAPQSVANWTYVGCFKDSKSQRLVKELILPANEPSLAPELMRVQWCLQYCNYLSYVKGYSVGALQYGQECWCGGDKLPAEVVAKSDDSLCNMQCSANATEFCGGDLTSQVYYLQRL